MLHPVKKKIARNTLANYISYFIRIAVSFFLFPFVVHRLGATQAGIWFLLSSITGYLGILDLGVKPALVKHIAQYNARGDKKAINEVVSTGFFIFLIIGIIAALAMVVIGIFFPQLFKISADVVPQAQISAYIVAAALLLSFPLSAVGGGVLNGLQRYDKSRTAGIFSALTGSAAIVFLLWKGYGLVAVVIADQVTNFLSWVLSFILAKKIAPYLAVRIKSITKKTLKEIFKFSWFVFLMELASQIIYHVDKIVIGVVLNVKFIVLYEAAYKIQKTITKIPMLIVSAIMPASSELNAQNNPLALKKLYLYSTKYMTAFFLFLVIPVLIFTKQILNIWVGAEYESAAIYAQLLLLTAFFVLNHTASAQILTGIGKIKKITRYQIIVAIMNLVLSVILAKLIGLIGVILGTVIPFVLMEWFYIKISFQTLGVGVKEYFSQVLLKAYLPALVSAGFLLVLSHYFSPQRILDIMLIMLSNFIIYGIIFYFIGVQKFEKEQLKLLIKQKSNEVPKNH